MCIGSCRMLHTLHTAGHRYTHCSYPPPGITHARQRPPRGTRTAYDGKPCGLPHGLLGLPHGVGAACTLPVGKVEYPFRRILSSMVYGAKEERSLYEARKDRVRCRHLLESYGEYSSCLDGRLKSESGEEVTEMYLSS